MNALRPWLAILALRAGLAAVLGGEVFISGSETGEWPGAAAIWRTPPAGAVLPERLALEWQTGEGVPGDMTVALCLKDKDGVWFQREVAVADAKGGGRGAALIALSPHDPDVAAVGHGGAWNEYARARVTEIGVRFASERAGAGDIQCRLTDAAAENDAGGDAPLSIARVRGGAGFALRGDEYAAPTTWAATAWRPFEIAFDLLPGAPRPHDADLLSVELEMETPAGQALSRPAFYDQPHIRWRDGAGREQTRPRGRAAWKARFTPTAPGRHRWRIVAKTEEESRALTGWRTLGIAPGAPRGFVRPSETDPSHFADAGGEPFWPLGLNLHSPVDQRYIRLARRAPGAPPADAGTFFYEARFARMAGAGMNAAIVWMANWNFSLEWNRDWKGFGGLGDYHQANAWRLDQVFAAAARHGIHILLVLDNHGKLSNGIDAEWPSSPYNAANGGPCRRPEDFWTNDEAFRHYAHRLRYIVARWGAHPNLLGYILVSEINWTGSRPAMGNLPGHVAWLERVRAALRKIDVHDRPVTIQYSGRPGDWDARVAAADALSFLSVNAYRSGAPLPDLLRDIHARAAAFDKPAVVAEFGGDWNATTPARLHADLRAGLWTALAAGAPAAPFFWWHEFVDENDLYGEFLPVAAIAENTRLADAEDNGRQPLETVVTENGQPARRLKAVASANNRGARLWLADAAALEIIPASAPPLHAGVTVTLPGFPPGGSNTHPSKSWRVSWFDTGDGSLIKEERVDAAADAPLFRAPPFATGVFAIVRSIERGKR